MPEKKRSRLVWRILTVIAGLIVLLAIILFLSLPTLLAPEESIPPTNQAQVTADLRNVQTKLQASAIGLITSGGQLSITLSETELNAFLVRNLTQKLGNSLKLLGSTTTISAKGYIDVNLALGWHSYVIGVKARMQPLISSDKQLYINLISLKLGRIPLPPSLVLNYLQQYLPSGVNVKPPASIVINPGSVLTGYPQLIKNPQINLQSLFFTDHYLRLIARLTFSLF